MDTVLSGSLTRFSPIYVVRLLQSSRATGRLEFRRGDDVAELWIHDGECLYARTSGRNVRVGDILVRNGHLPEAAIELALAIQEDLPGQRLGAMLVQGGAISDPQLTEALLALQRHVLAGVLLWRAGAFRFMADERLPGIAGETTLASDGRAEAMLQSILALAEQEQRFSGGAAERARSGEDDERAA